MTSYYVEKPKIMQLETTDKIWTLAYFIEEKLNYYGCNSKIKVSFNSDSVYIKFKNEQIRLSDHKQNPKYKNNSTLDIDFLKDGGTRDFDKANSIIIKFLINFFKN